MTSEWVPDALGFAFMQRALIACAIVCATAPLVGTFVVQRRQALVGDGMGHVAFAGVGAAFLTGVAPAVGALGICVLGAWALYRLQRGGLSGDLSLALLFYGGIAVGFILTARSGIGLNSVLGFLFGSPLTLTWATVGAVAGLGLAAAVVIVVVYPAMLAVAFDEAAARVSGVPADGLILALTVMVALVVVGGMHVVGILLVSGMMVIPVAAAAQVATSYRATMVIASALGAASAVTGLLVAYYADLTPGGSIVMTAIACYVLARIVRRMRASPARHVATT